ncbi:MAG TPA: RHS repeat-associated core domain-containing protein, partial [Terriglobales bacterium]|nr:RHS repeat-associated core domain-containing protein [Terriglobales bacterium]
YREQTENGAQQDMPRSSMRERPCFHEEHLTPEFATLPVRYRKQDSYDVLDNLLSVTQNSSRNRTFTYDSLSRLTCAANPEVTSSTNVPASCPATNTGMYTAGTIGYAYDSYGNLLTKTAPAPNQTATSSTVATSYSYDKLNRLIQKTYAGGATTASVQYGYDGTVLTGCATAPPTLSDSNPIGSRTGMCDGSGATSWSHDSMNRILTEDRTINGTSALTKSIVYSYYVDGELKTIKYPPGLDGTVTYTPNGSGGFSAGRAISAVDTGNSINYVTSATYAPHGAQATITNGASILGAFSYNSRLQPLQIFYGTNTPPSLTGSTCPATVGNILHSVYNFNVGAGDNGNVTSIANCQNANLTKNFTYDSLNRVETAATQGTTCTDCWGQMFGHLSGSTFVPGIDAWGNLFQITATQGSPTTLSQSMTANNQFVGMTYDASGNLINNGGGDTYTFNDENRLTATAGYTYVYDGDGQRVEKCSNSSCTAGTMYWRMTGGDTLSESSLTGSITEEYIFLNGKRIARRDNSGGAVHYYFADHLGSADVITDNLGNIEKESDYYPYGGEIVITGSDINNYKFTGKERDAESGLDNFGARYNASAMGRFMTPDPLLNSGHPGNPQTWNRYSYALNNPLKIKDPTGLYNVNCGDDKGCQKAAKRLKEALEKLQNKVDAMKDSDQKTRLENALGAMGTENDHNKVNVSFGAIAGTGAATTDAHFDSATNSYGSFDVKFDMSKASNSDTNGMAINGAHEGTHVGDYQDPFGRSQNPATAMDGFQYEFRGYETSAWAAQALGVSPLSVGNNVIWNSTWAAADRQTLMDRHITGIVTGAPYNYPENPIHDPWPDRFPEPNPGPF